jgi:hypothetical protein
VTAHNDTRKDHNYETRDASYPRVMVTAFSLIGVMVVGLAFAWGVYEIFGTQEEGRPGNRAETFLRPDTAHLPPGPNLEADPSESLAKLHEREDSVLNGYGWTDSARGIARVPVARAMELYLEKEHRQ